MQEEIASHHQFPAIIELSSIDSTNNYALQLIREGLAYHGLGIFAQEQTAGKGQRGRAWASEPGQNLAASLIMQPGGILIHNQFLLSAAVALGARQFIQDTIETKTLIKWPNDLYIQDRKAGGILIENIFHGQKQWKWAVAGIGININQIIFDPELPNPISLRQITGKNYDCLQLAHELRKYIFKYFNKLSVTSTEHIIALYNSYLYKRNEKVKLKAGSRLFEAEIKKVSLNGKILVMHSMEEEFSFGDIIWLRE